MNDKSDLYARSIDHDADWRKARKSQLQQPFCVEVHTFDDGSVAVRDSKNRSRGDLRFDAGEWDAFCDGVRNGEF